MARLHFGQCFVLASTHLAVSPSEVLLTTHARVVSHDDGRCASSPHRKQNTWLQRHVTSYAPDPGCDRTARVHPGPGHHRTYLLVPSSTKDRTTNRARSAPVATASTSSRTTGTLQGGSGQRSSRHPEPASVTATWT
nr:unnamed protein product [Digitaria exilis]